MRISDWSSDVCSSDLIADVHAQRAGLDPCNDATLALPGLCPIAGLGIVAQDGTLTLGALDRAGIGERNNGGVGAQRWIGGPAEHGIAAGGRKRGGSGKSGQVVDKLGGRRIK